MGMTLFYSALCKLRRAHFPCCSVLCDSQGWCTVADAAVAKNLPWLCMFPWGEVDCLQPTPPEHFSVELFPPGIRKLAQIQTGLQGQPGADIQTHTLSVARGWYCERELQKVTRLCWKLSKARQNEMLGMGLSELLLLCWGWAPTQGPLPGTGCWHLLVLLEYRAGKALLHRWVWGPSVWICCVGPFFSIVSLVLRRLQENLFFTPFSAATKLDSLLTKTLS